MTVTGGSALPKDDIDRMVREAEQHAEEDRRRRETAAPRSQGEQLVYSTEKLIEDNADKIPADARNETETALAELKEKLKGEDTAAIRQAIDRTAQAAQWIGTALYEKSRAEQPAGDTGAAVGGGTAGGSSEDDVVDAEIVDDDKAGGRLTMTGSRPQATELAELRRLVEERTADLQRVKAEYDNYRKRVRRDRLAVREIAVVNVLRALLPVLDAVDRACAHEPLTPGLKDIADSLSEQLGSLGVTSFGEVGDPFDPACHDALAHHAAPDRDRLVCSAVLRPGYRLGDHLLRPAHVEVTGPAPPARNAHGGDRGVRPSTDGAPPPFPIARS